MRFFCLCVLAILIIPSRLKGQTDSIPVYNLLWKIERSDLLKPSYLFGTMHVRSTNAFQFSDSVLVKLRESDVYVAEVDIDSMIVQIFNNVSGFEKNYGNIEVPFDNSFIPFLEQYIDQYDTVEEPEPEESIFSKIVQGLKDQFTELLSEKENLMPVFLDAYLNDLAKHYDIPTMGIETLKLQEVVIDSLYRKFEEELDNEKLDSLLKVYPGNEKMLSLYKQGNIEEIWGFYRQFEMLGHEILIDHRNVNMVKSIEPLLKLQSLFIAVGVAHLPGEMGLIHLLEEKGYTLSPVKASFTGIAQAMLRGPIQNSWKLFADSLSGYALEQPFRNIPIPFQGGITQMNVSHSFLKKQFYYHLAIPSTYIALSGADNVLDYITNFLIKHPSTKVMSEKSVMHSGVSGLELELNHANRFRFKLRAFEVGKKLFLFMVGPNKATYESASAIRFFKSIEFYPADAEPAGSEKWDVEHFESGAFSIKLPTEPYRISNEDNEYICVNGFDDEIYKVRWFNRSFRYREADSLEFRDILLEEFGGEYLPTLKPIALHGVEGFSAAEPFRWKNFETHTIALFRGNRVYVLFGQTALGKSYRRIDQFFDSFKPLPFKISTFPFKQLQELHIQLPKDLVVHRDKYVEVPEYRKSSGIPFHQYSGTDPHSGTYFDITIFTFPKYFAIDHPDSLFNRLEKGSIYSEFLDQVNRERQHRGAQSRSATWVSDSVDFTFRYQYSMKNGKVYAIYIMNNNIIDDFIDDIFQNIHIDDEDQTTDFYARKSGQLLQDLKSRDLSVFNEAKAGLQYYTFDSLDADLLHEALFYDYLDSGNSSYSVKSRLLEEVQHLDHKNTFHIFYEFYHKYPSMRAKVIHSFINLPAKENKRIIELLCITQKDEVGTEQLTTVLYGLLDSVAVWQFEVPKLLQAADNNLHLKAAFLKVLVDSLNHEGAIKNLITRKVLSWYNQFHQDLSEVDKYADEFYEIHEGLLLCMSYFIQNPSRLFDKMAEKALESSLEYVRLAAVKYALSQNLKVKRKILDEVMARLGWEVVLFLSEQRMMNVLPKRHVRGESLAKYALLDFLSDEFIDEKVINIDFVNSRTLSYGEKEYTYYYFDYSVSPHVKYLAITGGINYSGEEVNLDNLFIDYIYMYEGTDLKIDKKKVMQDLLQRTGKY